MSDRCTELDHCDRLDGAHLEEHFASCPECRRKHAGANPARARLKGWGDTKRIGEPSEQLVQSLLRKAKVESPPRVPVRVWIAIAAPACVALLAAVVWTRFPTAQAPALPLVVVTGESLAPLPATVTPSTELAAPRGKALVVLLGRDRIGVDQAARATVMHASAAETIMRLEQGTIACHIEPGQGRTFMVDTGELRITVKGTRFQVERNGSRVRVAVDSGTVLLSLRGASTLELNPGESATVSPGELAVTRPISERETAVTNSLLRGEVPKEPALDGSPSAQPVSSPDPAAGAGLRQQPSRGPTAKAADGEPLPAENEGQPEIGAWRALIASGDTAGAKRALVLYLNAHPDDSEALLLLATCERKLGQFSAATELYLKLVDAPDPKLRSHARYLAATLYQDQLRDPARALTLLEAFVTQAGAGDPLLPEALVRLARAHWTAGNRERALAALQRVLDHHGGTPAALEARKLQKAYGK